MVLSADWKTIVSMTAVAFWLFIGAEYVIPISKDVKNAKRNVPLGMFLGLGLICVVQSVLVFGFHNYTPWDKLADSAAPHLLYGENLLGNVGKKCVGVVQFPRITADKWVANTRIRILMNHTPTNGTLFLFSFLKQRGIIFIFAIP